jgi:uroporphyrinogen-III synthase
MRTDEARPLAATRVLVTRAATQGGALIEKLRAVGATVVAAPAIQILPPEDDTPLADSVAALARYGWLICTSANAVRAVADRRDGAPLPTGLRIAAVGSATARALQDAFGRGADFQPSAAVAEALGRELPLADGERLLWPRSALAGDALADALRARGGAVDAPIAYRTVASIELLGIADAIRDRRVDAVTFTSPSTVRHFVDGLAAAGLRFTKLAADARPAVVVIGPVTAAAAEECGLAVDAVAASSDDDGLVQAVIHSISRRVSAA